MGPIRLNLDGLVFAIIILIASVISVPVATYMITNDAWERETIEMELAEHNPVTGKWQWKTNDEPRLELE